MPDRNLQPPRVFVVDLDDKAVDNLLRHRNWLSGSEDQIAEHPGHQPHLAARIVLRAVLARQTKVPPGQIRIVQGRYGKPGVTGGPEFNISHSGHRIAIATHPTCAVGIDLELRDRAIDPVRLGAVLTAEETAAVRDIVPNRMAWLTLWTRKEAVAKAAGLGLHLDPARIPAGFPPADPKLYRPVKIADAAPSLRDRFHLIDLALPSGDPAALAIAADIPPDASPVVEELDPAALSRGWLPTAP